MLDATQHGPLLRDRRRLFGYACALSADMSGAEDLYQDTVLRAVAAKSVPQDQTAYRVWLFRIMRNLWIDRLRAEGRLPDFDDSTDIDGLSGTEGSADQMVNALAVRLAFQKLSKQHRDVLAVVDICGFSYTEAAEMLEVPPGTIMSRISRARQALIRCLNEDDRVIALPLCKPRRGRRDGR